LTVAGKRIDETIAVEMLRAVTPMAIEAAEEAERMLTDEDQDRRRIAELELQQAQYSLSASMAGRWSDQDIAASLNRMGMPTGQGKTWTAHRVGSVRRVRGIHGYRPAEKNGEWLTMRDAAAKLGVSHHQIRKLIKAGVLASEQIMPDAPHQIRAADLGSERVGLIAAAAGVTSACKKRGKSQRK
jgi:hypothetical protein